jgi:hypothetical protein
MAIFFREIDLFDFTSFLMDNKIIPSVRDWQQTMDDSKSQVRWRWT